MYKVPIAAATAHLYELHIHMHYYTARGHKISTIFLQAYINYILFGFHVVKHFVSAPHTPKQGISLNHKPNYFIHSQLCVLRRNGLSCNTHSYR